MSLTTLPEFEVVVEQDSRTCIRRVKMISPVLTAERLDKLIRCGSIDYDCGDDAETFGCVKIAGLVVAIFTDVLSVSPEVWASYSEPASVLN